MKSKKIPTPEELLTEIQGQPAAKAYAFADYLPVLHAMQQKGFSYADMSEFLKKRLGFVASRGQVYRAYQAWLEEQRQSGESDFEPEPTFQNEYDEKVYQRAQELIDELQERDNANEPWDSPRAILREAVRILEDRDASEKAAEEAAANADKLIESGKGKKKVSVK